MLVRMWRKRNTSPLLVGFSILVQPLWKIFSCFLRKLEIVLHEDPAIPILGINLKDPSTFNKNTCSTMFIAALFIIS